MPASMSVIVIKNRIKRNGKLIDSLDWMCIIGYNKNDVIETTDRKQIKQTVDVQAL